MNQWLRKGVGRVLRNAKTPVKLETNNFKCLRDDFSSRLLDNNQILNSAYQDFPILIGSI